MKKLYISTLALALLSLTSCNNDFENSTNDVVITSGEANFSNYVALGNSLTSGYRDNALYIDGQVESYPNMLAAQMKRAGGGEFVQPLMADNNGGMVFGNNIIQSTKLYIKDMVNGKPVLVNVEATPTTDVTKKITGKINNMGIPGAKSYHLVYPGYGSLANLLAGKSNPYYVRFASSETSTVAGDAVAQRPTFFSLWIGNNDVLSYATSGGMGVDQKGNIDPSTYGPNDISDPNVVAGSIKAVLDALKAAGATKGVIANIPDVSAIPFFTTVPYNPVSPADLGPNLNVLNSSLYGPLKQALTYLGAGDRINLLSATSANPVLIVDKDLPNLASQLTQVLTPSVGAQTAALLGQVFGQARQTTADDLIVLNASSVIGQTNPNAPHPSVNVNGISFPLADQYVLTKAEAAKVSAAVKAYNSQIAALASSYGLALVDANAKMLELNSASGIQFDGVKYTAKFITGGSFSLDGVHLTGRGYAVVANEFIKAINMKYRSNLPMVNPNSYSGVKFP